MRLPRFRLSSLLLGMAIAAALLAFWREMSTGSSLSPIPSALLVIQLAIILITGAIIAQSLLRK